MSKSLDERLSDIEEIASNEKIYIGCYTWFMLATVAVRALILIAQSIRSLAANSALRS